MTDTTVDWDTLVARVLAGERAKEVAREAGVDGRALNCKSMHARPDYAAAHAERARNLIRHVHADPVISERIRVNSAKGRARYRADPERYPLARLTQAEREHYDVLRQNGHYSRREALEMIGRLDILEDR